MNVDRSIAKASIRHFSQRLLWNKTENEGSAAIFQEGTMEGRKATSSPQSLRRDKGLNAVSAATATNVSIRGRQGHSGRRLATSNKTGGRTGRLTPGLAHAIGTSEEGQHEPLTAHGQRRDGEERTRLPRQLGDLMRTECHELSPRDKRTSHATEQCLSGVTSVGGEQHRRAGQHMFWGRGKATSAAVWLSWCGGCRGSRASPTLVSQGR